MAPLFSKFSSVITLKFFLSMNLYRKCLEKSKNLMGVNCPPTDFGNYSKIEELKKYLARLYKQICKNNIMSLDNMTASSLKTGANKTENICATTAYEDYSIRQSYSELKQSSQY